MQKSPQKIIIAGGRDFIANDSHVAFLDQKLADFDGYFEVVCGMARGADLFGYTWAKKTALKIHEFPADWNRHGKAAGFIRNKQMGDFADALIAFPGGRGTQHMIGYMTLLKKPVHLYMEYQ